MIERLLGELAPTTFLDEHYGRLPYSSPGGAREFLARATWGTAERVLAEPEADAMIVRQGRRWDGSVRPSFPTASRLFDEGYTLLIRHAERQDAGLAELAAGFACDFAAPVDVHLYYTPAEEHGFGWHYDAEDVFILQTEGIKEYSLRKNTVNPWPLAEALPQDMRYEREIMPLMKCRLAAGDWLYIPNGYWHVAQAYEPSISIAVGVMTPPALAAFDWLRPQLLDSLRWRQRLPVAGAATSDREALFERYREIFAELGDDLSQTFRDEAFVRAYLESQLK